MRIYGTSDQAGNVWEWNEGLFVEEAGDTYYRVARGSGWRDNNTNSAAYVRDLQDASLERDVRGFRVAFVPEPSSLTLAALGLVGFAAWGWRRKP